VLVAYRHRPFGAVGVVACLLAGCYFLCLAANGQSYDRDPYSVGRWPNTNAFRIYNILPDRERVFLMLHTNGMVVLDISEPSRPVELVYYRTTNNLADGFVLSNLLYAVGSSGLTILDVADPANPRPIGLYRRTNATAVVVTNGLAYITYSPGLEIVNVQNPAAPALVCRIAFSSAASDLVVWQNYAYVAGAYGGLHVVDVRNPSTPVLVTNIPPFGATLDAKLADGNRLFVFDELKIRIFQLNTNGQIGPQVSGHDLDRETYPMADVHGKFYYVTVPSGVQMVHLDPPFSRWVIGRYYPLFATRLVATDDFVFAASGTNALEILSFTRPARPQRGAQLHAPGGGVH
jgi:hypothetical protein